ncbi:MAG: hypothetical protein H0V82_07925 [Candidatus Protochlamydia sp.]|nr:hypothetical protein [Candidatus Protochlamydia sp.]
MNNFGDYRDLRNNDSNNNYNHNLNNNNYKNKFNDFNYNSNDSYRDNTTNRFNHRTTDTQGSTRKIERRWENEISGKSNLSLGSKVNNFRKTTTFYEPREQNNYQNQSQPPQDKRAFCSPYEFTQTDKFALSNNQMTHKNNPNKMNRDIISSLNSNELENLSKKRKIDAEQPNLSQLKNEISDLVQKEQVLVKQADLIKEANRPQNEWEAAYRDYLIVAKKRQKLTIIYQKEELNKLKDINVEYNELKIKNQFLNEQNLLIKSELCNANTEIKKLA